MRIAPKGCGRICVPLSGRTRTQLWPLAGGQLMRRTHSGTGRARGPPRTKNRQMPQFPPRKTQPLKPDSYRRLARLVRVYAERIEANADTQDARAKKARTDAVNGLMQVARAHWRRHHGQPARPPLAAPVDAE